MTGTVALQRGQGHQGNRARESTKQGSWGLTETEVAVREPAWVCVRSSAYMCAVSSDGFCGALNCGR